jgi:uncharacterized membrane protein YfcA
MVKVCAMLRDFVGFLLALWKEWKALLTGGTILAVVSLGQKITGKSVPRSTNWLIFGLTLLLASFFAWRKECQRRRDERAARLQAEETLALRASSSQP